MGKVASRTKSTAARKPLSRVAELFSYDDEKGHLFWRFDHGRAKAGDRAGTIKPSGYRAIQIDGEFYQEHRVIWVLMTGDEIPEDKQVDHINQNKSDNRWVNLRLASPAQQQINTGVQKNNKHGKGVGWRDSNKKWRADIYVDGKAKCLGHFDSKTEAQEAYEAGAKMYYGEYAPQALPVDTNNPSSPKGSGVESLRSSEPVGLLTPNPQRLGGATRKDASPTAPNTNAGSPSQVRPPAHNGVIAGSNPAPATKFDKVAYQRVYMAKWRAEIKSGKRVPKRKGETT